MSGLEDLLWLVPALPLGSYLLLSFFGRRVDRAAGAIATGAIAFAFGLCVVLSFRAGPLEVELWRWIEVRDFAARVALRFDALAQTMALVVTGVGSLILLYSIEYMGEDEGYVRFFSHMSLFVGFMLILVLADDLLLLYLGWEGVGLSSYLLIGFWYRDPTAARAGDKAFLVTRAGDAAMAIGIFAVYSSLGTLAISKVDAWPSALPGATLAAALLLAGAVGKSAQVPLQIWLPDAMAGPTPVSALIHAATMVAAGVFLIARLSGLFSLASPVLVAIEVIGAVTLVLAGLSALAQRDIKRVLAYSTVSQLGYMFLALGAGAYSAAIFHLVTHAFFKALLFLGAGVVIKALGGEHDLFAMGGLRRSLPITFLCMLAGAASLSALPLITAGFYSKELILGLVFAREGVIPWTVGLVGSLITGLYAFRLVFLVFFGEARSRVKVLPGPLMSIPLVLLAALALWGGLFEPSTVAEAPSSLGLDVGAAGAALAGAVAAWFLARRIVAPPILAGGFGFDAAYRVLIVLPYRRLARLDRRDVFDLIPTFIASFAVLGHRAASHLQGGRVRMFTAAIAGGATVFILLMVFL